MRPNMIGGKFSQSKMIKVVFLFLLFSHCFCEVIHLKISKTIDKEEVIDTRTIGLFQNSIIVPTVRSNVPIEIELLPARGIMEVECGKKPLETIKVSKTDFYGFVVMVCPTNPGSQTLDLDATITIDSPFGKLPGKYAGNLIVFPILLVIWLVLLIIWIFNLRKEFFNLFIFSTLLLSFASVSFGTIDAFSSNYWGLNFFSYFRIIFALLQKISFRILSILIFMGYGTHVSQVGDKKYSLILYSLLYLSSVAFYEWFKETNPLLSSFPISTSDAIFFLWIFILTESTLEQLQEKKQFYKMQIILRMKYGFLIYLLFCLIIMTFQIIFQMYYYADWWYLDFLFNFVWEIGLIAMLSFVLFLFFPHADQKRWIDAEEIQQEETFDDQDIQDVLMDDEKEESPEKDEKVVTTIEEKVEHKD